MRLRRQRKRQPHSARVPARGHPRDFQAAETLLCPVLQTALPARASPETPCSSNLVDREQREGLNRNQRT